MERDEGNHIEGEQVEIFLLFFFLDLRPVHTFNRNSLVSLFVCLSIIELTLGGLLPRHRPVVHSHGNHSGANVMPLLYFVVLRYFFSYVTASLQYPSTSILSLIRGFWSYLLHKFLLRRLLSSWDTRTPRDVLDSSSSVCLSCYIRGASCGRTFTKRRTAFRGPPSGDSWSQWRNSTRPA